MAASTISFATAVLLIILQIHSAVAIAEQTFEASSSSVFYPPPPSSLSSTTPPPLSIYGAHFIFDTHYVVTHLDAFVPSLGAEAASNPAASSWSGPFTIFALSDSSVRSCSTCSIPRILQEHIVPGVFTMQYLKKLVFGTKVEAIAPGICMTITSAVNNSKLVGAVESEEFNVWEGGAEEDGAGKGEGGAEEPRTLRGMGKEDPRRTVRGKGKEEPMRRTVRGKGKEVPRRRTVPGMGKEVPRRRTVQGMGKEDGAGEGDRGAEDEIGHQQYDEDSDDDEHGGPQRRVDREVRRELTRQKEALVREGSSVHIPDFIRMPPANPTPNPELLAAFNQRAAAMIVPVDALPLPENLRQN